MNPDDQKRSIGDASFNVLRMGRSEFLSPKQERQNPPYQSVVSLVHQGDLQLKRLNVAS